MQFVTNKTSGKLTRREVVDGVEYLVAPGVMFKEGVWNGELVSSAELSNHCASWNGQPIIIGHPKENGVHTSTNDPETLARRQVGKVFNARFEDGKLKGDHWIDLAKARHVEGGLEVIRRLEQNAPLEISTAYFRDLEEIPGTFQDQSYRGAARNLHADHLAILLDERGACNWQDGCGFPRVNSNTKAMVAFYLPPEVSNALAMPDGVNPDDLHLTAAFLGDAVDVNKEKLLAAVGEFAAQQKPISGSINGAGRFNETNDDGHRPVYANFDAPTLPAARAQLVSALKQAQVGVVENHGFTPHVTLGYTSDWSVPDVELIEGVNLGEISAVIGDETFSFPLGEPMQTNAVKKARRPAYDGIEEVSWEDAPKTFDAYRDAFYEHTGAEKPETPLTRIADAPQSMRDWIASKSLLGDPDAEDFDNLAFFPVVNPLTNKLNAGAVKAVLGGRGSQVDLAPAVLESAQDIARGLLDKVNAQEQSNTTTSIRDMLQAVLEKLGIKPGDSESDESDMEVNMGRDEMIATILADGRLPFAEEQLAEFTDEVLTSLQGGLAALPPVEEPIVEAEKEVEPVVKTPDEELPMANEAPCIPEEVKQFMASLEKMGGADALFGRLAGLQANEETHKAALVAELVANEHNALDEAELNALPVGTLEKLAQSFRPADYSGQIGPVYNASELIPMTMPDIFAQEVQ